MANIHQAITDIMSEGYAITKDKRNQTQGFMYRGIDDVMNTFQPLLAKHHVFVVPEVIEQQRMERTTGKDRTLLYAILKMRYTFYAEDGSSISAVVIGEGMDSGDKASNKAMSAAMKYAMFQVFCIPTEEMADPDADTPPASKPKEPEQRRELPAHCADCGKVIMPYRDAQGRLIAIAKWAAGTEAKYGRVLCDECEAKAREALAAQPAPEERL